MPLVGALIGWITNLLAIRLLFRPYNKIYIPFTKIYLQGVLPKRRDEIAESIGQVVENELLNVDDLFAQLVKDDTFNEAVSLIVTAVQNRLDEHMPGFLPEGIRLRICDFVGNFVDREVRNTFSDVKENLFKQLGQSVNIAELVKNRIKSLDVRQVEDLVVQTAKTELKHIEIMGGVLGLLIGIVQALVMGLEGIWF